MIVDPNEVTVQEMQGYLQGAIVPRPIAFASTQDSNGNVNLSPFSFFNVFSSNPPVVVFSPSRRARDNSTKHSLENVREVPEVVINIVNFSMVQQASLSSTEYPKGVNEFVKAGLTPVSSAKVKPPRVNESPVSFECVVNEIIPLGEKGGAGNLVICEVVLAHIKDEILNASKQIDPFKLDAVARMGANWYCRAQGEAIFEVPKPLQKLGIGIDSIPSSIRYSSVLTGNDLGMLGNVELLPTRQEVDEVSRRGDVKQANAIGIEANHRLAATYLKSGNVNDAWKVLLSFEQK